MMNEKSVEYWRKRYNLLEERLYSQYAYNNTKEIKKYLIILLQILIKK